MGRNVTLDFSAGGGSDAEFLIGTITLEPTAVHEIGNRVVLPHPRSTGINAGVGVLEDVAISPAGPEPAWAYLATVRDSISGKAQSWLVGVPTGTTAIPFKQLTKFTTTIPPQTTAGMMQNWADTTEVNAERSEIAADRAEAPTDLMNKNLIENAASLTAGALSAALVGKKTTAAQETATVGANIANGSGWVLGAGWTGDFSSGFTHTPGSIASLTWNPPTGTGTQTWLVEWQYSGPEGVHQFVYSGYDVYLGGGYAGITYQGAGASNINFSRGIKSLANGNLEFKPWTEFDGTISNITVRPLTAAAAIPPSSWLDSAGFRTAELRFGQSVLDNTFLGKDSGKWNYSGNSNVGIGSQALRENATGFFNVAIGKEAMVLNTNGTRNTAIGYRSLQLNSSGDRNVGIGPFSLTRNTTGSANVAIGVDVLWKNAVGSDNIGIGYLALTELGDYGDAASGNIALGKYAMRQAKLGNRNIGIGEEALFGTTGEDGIGIGTRAMFKNVSAESVAIGVDALTSVTGALANGGQVAIGARALRRGESASQFDKNTAVGHEAGENLFRGRNTVMGYQALKGDPSAVISGTQGSRTTAVGYQAGLAMTTGESNLFLGYAAGSNLTTQSRNILIGNGVAAVAGRDDFLNIGSLLYGDLAAGNFGIGVQTPTARLHLGANRATPGGAIMKLSGGTLLAVLENNAVEFDGSDLYLTANGTRFRLNKTAV